MSVLSVIEGGAGENAEQVEKVGSTAWMGRARNRAKVLAEQVEMGYLELGELLYRIYDAPVDGDPQKGSVLQRWGYNNIGEFAERELGIHYKKAQRLIRIFYRIEVELGGLDNAELKARFRKIGWSKARELVRVMTKETAEFWISKAEQVNFTTITEIVRQTLERAEQAKIKAEIAKQPDAVEESNRTSAEGRPIGDFSDSDNPLFMDTSWVVRNFRLEASQAETVDLAIKRARDLSNNAKVKPGTLLSLVCLEFLSNADWKGNDEGSKLKFLAKIEKSLSGLKLVAVNESGEVVYGLGALELAASTMQAEAAEPQEDGASNATSASDDHRF